MPMYEYRCETCEETFEVIRSYADKSPEPCPECGEPAEKQLSAFARAVSGDVCSPGSGGSFGGG